jgi:hypothetical protein
MLFKKPSYIFYAINICLLALALGIFIKADVSEDQKAKSGFQSNYQIYSIPTPEFCTFAGQKISLRDPDAQERFDREMLTNVYWQSQTILFIKRANRFFPSIERILRQQGIPLDFKYLAIAESGLQQVVSPAGAAGYWQFLDKTGKRYGLEITEEVDERYNIEKSTLAACKYFKEAYAQFGDWALVAASYNMGIEGVKRQVRSQSIKKYEDLYLNTETSRYLFRILSIKEILEHPETYGFHVPFNHLYSEPAIVIVKADISISNLTEFANENYCNYKLLKWYNPWMRKPFLNIAPGKMYEIKLPADRILNSPLASKVKDGILQLGDMKMDSIVKEDLILEFEYEVQKGETLESIAKKQNISKENLMMWNGLTYEQALKPGTKLKIKRVDE